MTFSHTEEDFSVIQQEIVIVKSCKHRNIVAYYGSYIQWVGTEQALPHTATSHTLVGIGWYGLIGNIISCDHDKVTGSITLSYDR